MVHSFGEIAPTIRIFPSVALVCWAVPVINTTGIEDPTNLVCVPPSTIGALDQYQPIMDLW